VAHAVHDLIGAAGSVKVVFGESSAKKRSKRSCADHADQRWVLRVVEIINPAGAVKIIGSGSAMLTVLKGPHWVAHAVHDLIRAAGSLNVVCSSLGWLHKADSSAGHRLGIESAIQKESVVKSACCIDATVFARGRSLCSSFG